MCLIVAEVTNVSKNQTYINKKVKKYKIMNLIRIQTEGAIHIAILLTWESRRQNLDLHKVSLTLVVISVRHKNENKSQQRMLKISTAMAMWLYFFFIFIESKRKCVSFARKQWWLWRVKCQKTTKHVMNCALNCTWLLQDYQRLCYTLASAAHLNSTQ